jgi:hypothetical protein
MLNRHLAHHVSVWVTKGERRRRIVIHELEVESTMNPARGVEYQLPNVKMLLHAAYASKLGVGISLLRSDAISGVKQMYLI